MMVQKLFYGLAKVFPFPLPQGEERRVDPQSGIAIGAILFAIALMAIIGIAVGSSGSFMGTTVTPDRVNADLRSQGNLIRSKILECFTYGYDRGDLTDRYPASTGTGTLVESLDCPSYSTGSTNMWIGQSPATLPPPPTGFDKWVYKNAGASGGRCIRIQPATGNTNDVGIKNGLAQLSGNFSPQEFVYSTSSTSQRFILWITYPTGTADADCSS